MGNGGPGVSMLTVQGLQNSPMAQGPLLYAEVG